MRPKPYNDLMDLVARSKSTEQSWNRLIMVVERTDLTFKQKCHILDMISIMSSKLYYPNRPLPDGCVGEAIQSVLKYTDTWELAWHDRIMAGRQYVGSNPILLNISILCR